MVQVHRKLSTADAEHTLGVLEAHKVTLLHLRQGLGLNSGHQPSEERREKMITNLTREYDSKPSLRTDCAHTLVDAIIESHLLEHLIDDGELLE